MKYQITKYINGRQGFKALGVTFVATFLVFSVGCTAKPKTIYWTVTKQTTKQLRKNDIHVLKEYGVHVIQLGQTVKVIFPSNRLFHKNSANLKSSYRAALNTAAKFIRTYDTVSIQVAAYSDNVTRVTNPSNFKKALLTRQAQVVGNYLYSRKVNTRLVYAVGYVNKNYVALNKTAKGRHINRRVEVSFRFYPKQNKQYD